MISNVTLETTTATANVCNTVAWASVILKAVAAVDHISSVNTANAKALDWEYWVMTKQSQAAERANRDHEKSRCQPKPVR
jgi:hypothetical protein